MPKCPQCNGTGYESFWEDDHFFQDACYHCGNTGHLSDEELMHDKLKNVIYSLAQYLADEYINSKDDNPDGEDFVFIAAENGLSYNDYRSGVICGYVDQLILGSFKLSTEDCNKLISEYESGINVKILINKWFSSEIR